MPKPGTSTKTIAKRKNPFIEDEATVDKGSKGKKIPKKRREPEESSDEFLSGTSETEGSEEEEDFPLPKKQIQKKRAKKKTQDVALIMDPNTNVEVDLFIDEVQNKEPQHNDDLLVLSGILDKKKFEEMSKKLRKEACVGALATPMHTFPYIQIGKNTNFTACFSPESGKTNFYIWRGKKTDDVENMKQVFKLSEAGFSNILRAKDTFMKFTHDIELFRQRCEAGLIKEPEQEKYMPTVPEPLLVEITARGSVQMVGYTFTTGIGGGVSLRYAGNVGEIAAPIGFTPAQFCLLMEAYLPLVQNVSSAVDGMYAAIREKEHVKDNAGPSDFWKTA
jgi:hypothetical protein